MTSKTETIKLNLAKVFSGSGKREKRPWLAILLFLGPITIYYLFFIAYPLFKTLYFSFHAIVPMQGQTVTIPVGFTQYKALFQDKIFFMAVKNTLLWAVVGPALEMITALALAFFVYFRVPLHKFYRVAWFTPILVSGVIVGLIFRWVFNYDWGLLNVTLRSLGLDVFALNWLGRVDTPIWVVIFVHYWATFGYSFVLLLAGLSAISEELLDAAKVDGANTLQTALKIMFPILMPTFVTVMILSFMGKMRAFHVVWVLTNGGPMHASETVATYVQKRAFGWSTLDLGYPSAIAVVWFGVVLIGVSLINRWLRKKAEY